MRHNAPQDPVPRCPGADELVAFTTGNLGLETLETLAAHLPECPRCRSRLRLLGDGNDVLIAALRRRLAPDPFVQEPERR
jgi:hypothetical protein